MPNVQLDNQSPKTTAFSGQILLADDDQQTCTAMSYVLRHLGYEVTTVSNGRDLIERATTISYDLAIIDIRMPVLDGMTTLAALKRNPATNGIPVILMTKYTSNDVITKCQELGAIDFISKADLKLDHLKQKIAHAMGYRKNEQTAQVPALPPMQNADESPAAQMGQSDPWMQTASSISACTAEETHVALEHAHLYLVFEQLKTEVANLKPDQTRQCCRLIETDPGAMCSILQFANVEMENQTEKIISVPQAIEKLGIHTVKKIITNMPTRPEDPVTNPWIIHWWRHAIATAHLAAAIGPYLGIDSDVARAMGMLHDIGRLQLINSEIGHSVVQTYDVARNVTMTMTSCEQIMLGMDHLEIGAEFCETHGLPECVSMACITHELTDQLRDRLLPDDAKRSALMSACDQIANAAGFCALPGIDLRPLPATARQFLGDAYTAIEQALTQASADIHWWLGQSVPQLCRTKTDITGINIVLISSYNNPWNPYRRTLTMAGGNVLIFSHLQQVTEHITRPDVVIIDQTATDLHSDLDHLNLIIQHYQETPLLLLAQRSDDPEYLVEHHQWPMHVYATPIRANSLLQAIRKLVAPTGKDVKK